MVDICLANNKAPSVPWTSPLKKGRKLHIVFSLTRENVYRQKGEMSKKMKYQELKEIKNKLRANTTKSEELLWKHIRKRQLLGRKFIRHHTMINISFSFLIFIAMRKN